MLSVKLGRKKRGKLDRPVFTEIQVIGGGQVPRNALSIGLYTLPVHGVVDQGHWLDTGSIIR